MAQSKRWPVPIENQDPALPKPLSQKDLASIRSRWLYTISIVIFTGVTLDQYSRHDPWFWAGIFCVVGNCHLGVRAWLLKWLQSRQQGQA